MESLDGPRSKEEIELDKVIEIFHDIGRDNVFSRISIDHHIQNKFILGEALKYLDSRTQQILRDERAQALRIYAYEELKKLCSKVSTVTFGEIAAKCLIRSLYNPEVAELTIPLKKLNKVLINTESCDSRQIERFITYAINYIGKTRLKKKVEVHICGEPEKLHQNLRNLFEDLFKAVKYE